MAGEITTPLLPCATIDEIVPFYEALGFRTTFRQRRPNGYAVVIRDDLALHFFSMDGFNPADSYGSCLVGVPDIGAFYAAFRDGLRALYGAVPTSGIPRLTRLRKKEQGGGGFALIDPGGNWIRVHQLDHRSEPADEHAPADTARSPLAKALGAAMLLGESKGDHREAARVLDSALARTGSAPADDRIAALVYRAELAQSLDDRRGAAHHLALLRAIPIDEQRRERVADELARVEELDHWLAGGGRT